MTHEYTQLADGRWQRKPRPADAPQAVVCYYMRDNHTFRELPLDVEAALLVIREEMDHGGYASCMLCGRPDGVAPKPIHALGFASWPEFETAARAWLEKAITLSNPPQEQRALEQIRDGAYP